jgi:hypothetical protein
VVRALVLWVYIHHGFLRRIWSAFSESASMNQSPNNSVEANRRPAAPLDIGRQVGSSSCAPPFLSAAVAHLWR